MSLLGIEKFDDLKIFEIGTVFLKNKEEIHVAYNIKKEIKEMSLDEFATEKLSSVEHENFLLKIFSVRRRHSSQGSPEETFSSRFSMWSLFPFIARDVSVWVPEEVDSSEVLKVIKDNAGSMVVRGPELFDEFKKDDKKSYAFRLVFQSYEKTLTDAEINEVMTQITNKIKDKETNGIGWQVR